MSDDSERDDDSSADDVAAIDDLPSDPAIGLPGRQGGLGPARYGSPTPIYQPTKSTALEDDDPHGAIPQPAIWVMKYRRHRTFRRRDDDELRVQLGEGDDAVYVISDGDDHVMACRAVGVDPQGVDYFLVGRLNEDDYHDYVNGFRAVTDLFGDAKDLALCSVYAALEAVSNVTLVDRYKRVDEVPAEYLPSSPFIEFSDDDDDDDGDGDVPGPGG
jgi:hypothetical protein